VKTYILLNVGAWIGTAALAFLASAAGCHSLAGYSVHSPVATGILAGTIVGSLAGLPEYWNSRHAVVSRSPTPLMLSGGIVCFLLWAGECLFARGMRVNYADPHSIAALLIPDAGFSNEHAAFILLIGFWIGGSMWLGIRLRQYFLTAH
jgi:hypothetical protein